MGRCCLWWVSGIQRQESEEAGEALGHGQSRRRTCGGRHRRRLCRTRRGWPGGIVCGGDAGRWHFSGRGGRRGAGGGIASAACLPSSTMEEAGKVVEEMARWGVVVVGGGAEEGMGGSGSRRHRRRPLLHIGSDGACWRAAGSHGCVSPFLGRWIRWGKR